MNGWLCGVALSSLAVLSACSDPVGDAEERYAIVANSGAGAAERCAAARAIPAAYLQAKRKDGYDSAQVKAEVDCQTAQQEEESGIFHDANGNTHVVTADNMDATISEAPASDTIGNSVDLGNLTENASDAD